MKNDTGQVLARFTITIPTNSEDYAMRTIYCQKCGEYVGAYHIKSYPDGYGPLTCVLCQYEQDKT